MTAHWYTLGVQQLVGPTPINWVADTIRVGLVTSTYAPSQDTDGFWITPQAYEVSGVGYGAGGIALTGKSVGGVTPTHEIPLYAASVQWIAASFTMRYAVVYKDTGSASTSPLLGWIDFGVQTVTMGIFGIKWDSVNGVLALNAT